MRLQLATEAEMFDIGIDVSLFLMAWIILLVTEDDCLASCTLKKNAVRCAHHMTFQRFILLDCCLLWLPCMCRYCGN